MHALPHRVVNILQLGLLVPDEPGVPDDGVLLPPLGNQVFKLAVVANGGAAGAVHLDGKCIALDDIHYKAKGPLRHINLDLSEFDTASVLMLSILGNLTWLLRMLNTAANK